MHYLNNNLVAVLAAGDVSVIQNQTVSWSDLPIHFLISIPFMLFILAPVFNRDSKTQIPELEAEVKA